MPQTPTSIGDQLAASAAPAPAAKPEPKPQAATATRGTEYLLLQAVGTDPDWRIIGTIPASSAREAIRRHAANVKETATLVAVPSRSWHPITVTVETVSRVTLA